MTDADLARLAELLVERVVARLHPSVLLPLPPLPANDHSPSPTPSPAA